ncbi:hypothetical protein GCM10008023_05960 [Sphingomonas glacialis]|uniref:Uncharacterized protein n=1 Tax=Sphingomonas glacialis TaxID=658225 RepID=A0ABQ3L9A9_9SPHN|nr:hypothetical protein [Sphingomonas glacialis]GHH09366.1 hypothetical protein GCM10008023_05960 [Sphingomonas glacialis]
MQNGFGSGVLWGTPLTDAYGAAIANPTPVNFGVLQDVSVDISFDTKMLYGSNQFPVALGRGKGKISCKAKMGQINGRLLNSLFFGQTAVSGVLSDYQDLTGAPIPATPYSITPTIAGAGTWVADLGVKNAFGVAMVCVASAPATGQYMVSAGVYTFAAADTGQTVFISYQYTATSTVAQKGTIMNVAMGYAPTFRCDFVNNYNSKSLSLSLFCCLTSKLTLATKQDDFLIPELDFDAFADPLNRVGMWSTSE